MGNLRKLAATGQIEKLLARAQAAEELSKARLDAVRRVAAEREAAERERDRRGEYLIRVTRERDEARAKANENADESRKWYRKYLDESERAHIDNRRLARIREEAPDWLWGRDEALAELNAILNEENGCICEEQGIGKPRWTSRCPMHGGGIEYHGGRGYESEPFFPSREDDTRCLTCGSNDPRTMFRLPSEDLCPDPFHAILNEENDDNPT